MTGLAVAMAVALLPAVTRTQPVFRAGVDLVHFGVSVVDRRGEPVTGLGPDDFQILEEGRPQTIQYFLRGDTLGERPPQHIGLLFDTSGSMIEDLQFAQGAAVKFLNTLTLAEDITLVDFDTEVRVARFTQADFPRLVERLRGRKPDGWTVLYDALGVYLDGAASQTGQKILVLYTDGGDTRSAMSFSEALDLLKASDVTLYVIGFLDHQSSFARNEQRLRLQQLAETTGGQAFFPSSVKQLDEMYGKVRQEIEGRYTLGYASTDRKTDGAWRRVEIKVTRSDARNVKVRTRAGYFAPYQDASRPQ